MKSKIILMVLGLMMVLFSYSSAQVPRMINYQGKLTASTGAPVNDTLPVIFSIYADGGGTTLLWTETQGAVIIDKGIFNVLLGSVNAIPFSVFDGSVRYLGVKVGADPEITPRKPMVSIPYAYRSAVADSVANGDGASCGWVDDGTVVRLQTSTDSVGIGTTSPSEQLQITGNLRLPVTTATVGIIKVGADRFIHNYGSGNTFVGINAGNLSMTGYDNTGNGVGALDSNTAGSLNTANGYHALYSNTVGAENSVNGYQALYSNTEGGDNTANGVSVLQHNTTGSYNTADGVEALDLNTTGSFNTAIGDFALNLNKTGSHNTALGDGATVSSPGFTNTTVIGANAWGDASNEVRIGDVNVTSIGGKVGWTTLSDGRFKKSISENVPGLDFISKLKPVTYTMDVDAIDAVMRPPRQLRKGQREEDLKPSAEEMASKQAQSQIVYTGFIAQEVEKAARETGYDFSGVDAPKDPQGMYGLRYAEFVVPLVKAVQEQQEIIKEQQKQINMLEQRVAELEKK